jgi:hypothetical protein
MISGVVSNWDSDYVVGAGTFSNVLLIQNGGVLLVTNENTDAVLEVRRGKVIFNGGVLQADKLVITNACGQFIRNGGTLIVGSLVLDPSLSAVGDGIPNGWKQQYGFDPLDPTVANADPDGDGFTNLQEFQAGTDPTNNLSALRMGGLTIQGSSALRMRAVTTQGSDGPIIQGSDVVISWQAGGGRTNVVQAAPSLLGVYFNISPNIVIPDAGDVVTNYLDSGAATNSMSRFYRVATRSASVKGSTAPTLTITSPVNGSYVIDPAVAVTGTSASSAGVSGVDVQGFAASSANGYSNWVAVVTGLKVGTNTLTVLAGDNAAPANIATNSIRVIYAAGDFDGNGDGLPDAWQIQYFGSVNAPNAQPAADPDGDGLSNLEEYLLGTDPTNADSFGDGISDGPLAPPGSGLVPGPDPNLVVVNGTVCYPFSGVGTVTIHMLNMSYGLTLCPFLRVSLSPTMSPSTVFDTTGGVTTYTLTESYSQPTNDIYLQFADAATNALGGVIHRTIPFFFEPGSARNTATLGLDTNLAIAALDTNGNWWARNVSIYASVDHAATNYVRNTNCWAQGFDLTCIAAYNSSEGNARRAGTLISPRHVMFANHYFPANGTALRFVANDNTVVTRVLSNSVQIALTDLRIGVLDSDVPTNLITFAKVLPSSFTNYFPNSLKPISSKYIPALCLNQNEDALESDISTVTAGISFKAPSDATRSLFYADKASGDSGQPAFIILNGRLVLLTVWTYSGGGSGWFVTAYLSQINSAMATLGGGYSLTTADLSPFSSCSGGIGQTP